MGISAWLVIIIPLIFIFYMAFYVKRYIHGAPVVLFPVECELAGGKEVSIK